MWKHKTYTGTTYGLNKRMWVHIRKKSQRIPWDFGLHRSVLYTPWFQLALNRKTLISVHATKKET